MVLQLSKLPLFRRCGWLSSSNGVFFTSEHQNFSQLPVRWPNTHKNCPVRRFATLKSGKVIPPKKKKRLDEVCLERFQQYSRNYIQSWILQGKVIVDGRVVTKSGHPVSDKSVVEIKAEIPKYVCRAGHKLEAAIEQLGIDVTGYGQVADKIRRDERVSVIERTNLRYLTELPQKVDLVTLDLSFISILVVMPAVISLMKEEATLVTLIKPQFEARRSQVGGGGIVRDPLVHQEVREKIVKGVEDLGFQCNGWIESPLKGAEGNIEFLACFSRTTVDSPVKVE
ncbi:unnamed protein product [Lactuca virosa]|uniref:RNA-binding S4 domain-containing protein n=1 Tax=Lactuca virosa TaxID=75947 RepID=A0AAU9PBG3_9ASTR|nr:unnamed protein product [Lactuca virosa]